MDLVVATPAEAHEVAPFMRATTVDRELVMDLIHQRGTPFLQALLAQRMLLQEPLPDSRPRAMIPPLHLR